MYSNGTDIRTTVNVRLDWHEMIIHYAEKTGVSKSDLINTLLEKQIRLMANNPHFRKRAMQYQPRGEGYKSMHVRLSHVQYDRFQDMMKIFRFCLSFILGLAMLNFKKLLKNDMEEDCYPVTCYCTICTEVDGIALYANYWGIPTKTHQIRIPPE